MRGLDAAAAQWLALALICSAYVQGGLAKALDFPAAVGEIARFGLRPAAPLAVLTIAIELGAAALVLSGYRRWFGALVLAAFTLAATLVANRFWERRRGERMATANAFFEHLGLVGAFLLIVSLDLAATAGTGAP
ncbi:DoxX family protein [Tahibacter sp.]|uniref:DoxX family protein n=1 Tax=Tahibacter sp. TaxID=2056211 RepID=UPI002D7F9C18|nr:DoxX family protein [Tahibacter sp.]